MGANQKSYMATVKRHMLYDVADNIVMNGGLYLCDAGPQEYSHTLFKQSYSKTLKRITSAMDEYTSIVDRKLRKYLAKIPRKRPKN